MLCCGGKFLYKKKAVSIKLSEAAIKKVDWNNFIFMIRSYQKNYYFATIMKVEGCCFTKMKPRQRNWDDEMMGVLGKFLYI